MIKLCSSLAASGGMWSTVGSRYPCGINWTSAGGDRDRTICRYIAIWYQLVPRAFSSHKWWRARSQDPLFSLYRGTGKASFYCDQKLDNLRQPVIFPELSFTITFCFLSHNKTSALFWNPAFSLGGLPLLAPSVRDLIRRHQGGI